MRKVPGMAINSDSAFNEGKAIRILEDCLEKNRRIKTFFKENDRTPNYDGSFELIEGNGTPKKQFIVQIKKTKALKTSTTGKHAGKFAYRMQTEFLFYVKNKVVESPAIYFVVDVENEVIFYVYLSYELLISLDFEAKSSITFWFDKTDILEEDSFYHKMVTIANERNEKYFMRPEEDIGRLQEAVYGLNTLLDTDFKKIKTAVFPDLWKFGIANSNASDFEIQFVGKEDNQVHFIHPQKTSVYALYPQMKGQLDSGIKEYTGAEKYFTSINMVDEVSPEEYVREVIHKIVRSFCENPSFQLLPTKALMEIVYEQNERMKVLLNGNSLNIKELLTRYYYLLDYLFKLLTADDITDQERIYREKITVNGSIRKGSIDFNDSLWMQLQRPLLQYIEKNRNTGKHKINIELVLNVLSKKWIRYFLIIEELKSRGVSEISEIWHYRTEDVFAGTKEATELIQQIIMQWWNDLPDVYNDFYSNVFETDKYRYKLKAKYSFDDHTKDYPYSIIGITEKIYKADNGINIQFSKLPLGTEFTDEDKQQGITSIISSLQPAEFVRDSRKTLFYDGIRCWLYQGICHALDIKPKGIKIGWSSRLLFN